MTVRISRSDLAVRAVRACRECSIPEIGGGETEVPCSIAVG